jgi:hypothetical protein
MYSQSHNHRRYQVRRSDTRPPAEGWELRRVVVRHGISFVFSSLVYTMQKEALEAGKRCVSAGN